MTTSNHPHELWQKKTFGVYHTSQGRRLPTHLAGLASPEEQDQNLRRFEEKEPVRRIEHAPFRPVEGIIHGARSYNSNMGLADPHADPYDRIRTNVENVRNIGRAYDSLPEFDQKAVPHFEAMRHEVNAQYDHLTNRMGVRVHPVDYDPYKNVHEMTEDLRNNKRIKVLKTAVTGEHPFFSNDENDKFRAVHDAFGHAATGRGFDAHGEEAAYLAHSRMFSPHALPAMASETRGQNASLHLNADFGPQRIAVLPHHVLNVPILGHGGPADLSERTAAGSYRPRASDFKDDEGYTPMYHGTHAQFKPGDTVDPGHESNTGMTRDGYVYFSHSPQGAAWHSRRGRVYQVKPTGEYGDDPGSTNSFRSKEPLQVVREMPMERVKQMRTPQFPDHRPTYVGKDEEYESDANHFDDMWHGGSRIAVRTGWAGPGNHKFARLLADDMPNMVKVAHDSGDSETVFHCPFCGSGQVIARNDGTIECEFCQACFTVQIQPQYPAFPQTINGMPVNVPGMGPQFPGQDGDPNAGQPADQAGGQMPPGVDDAPPTDGDGPEQPGGDEDDSEGGSDDDANPFAKKSMLYRTADGNWLGEEQYLKHLAFVTARDRNALAAKIRGE